MTNRTALQALADATGSVNSEQDAHDTLAQLMIDCRDLLPAAGAGVLVVAQPGVMDLLASTSHRASELELFQIQAENGPCVDCIATGEVITALGTEQIRSLWGRTGETIVTAGFDAVHAFPIRWNGTTVGGLNIFGRSPHSNHPDLVLGQAFADLIGILLMRNLDLDPEQIGARVRQVLAGRTIIEQAKGLLAYQKRIPLDDAYEQLRHVAEHTGQTLSDAAADVIEAAQMR